MSIFMKTGLSEHGRNLKPQQPTLLQFCMRVKDDDDENKDDEKGNAGQIKAEAVVEKNRMKEKQIKEKLKDRRREGR